MYINPFWVGVFATLVAEVAIIIIYAIFGGKKDE